MWDAAPTMDELEYMWTSMPMLQYRNKTYGILGWKAMVLCPLAAQLRCYVMKRNFLHVHAILTATIMLLIRKIFQWSIQMYQIKNVEFKWI